MLHHYYFLCGMRIKITGALVQVQDILYVYFGGQSGSGMGLSLSTSVLLTASLNETPTHTILYYCRY